MEKGFTTWTNMRYLQKLITVKKREYQLKFTFFPQKVSTTLRDNIYYRPYTGRKLTSSELLMYVQFTSCLNTIYWGFRNFRISLKNTGMRTRRVTVCFCHVTHAFQSESTLYSLAKWLSESTLYSLARWLSVRLRKCILVTYFKRNGF